MDAAFEVLLSSLSEAEPNNDRAPTLLRRREEDRDMCFPSGGPSAPGRRLSSRPQGQGGSLVVRVAAQKRGHNVRF